MSIISVKNVSKIYGNDKESKVEALKPISFELNKGDFLSIIGTSGSGKSTLLHLLAGVDNATTGNIMINNKDITTLSRDELAIFRREEVGIIYQFFNLVPTLTVRKNIELPLRLNNVEVDQSYFNELVNLLKIEDKVNSLPKKLSGGQQQRVAIARALIHKPSIILADEPTGNLNSVLAKEIMDFFTLISDEFNQTIIMITHDLNLAKYADRVIEIQDGEIVRDIDTYSGLQLEETQFGIIDKDEIIKRVEERIKQATDANEAIEDIHSSYTYEGIDEDSGNYYINQDRFHMVFTSFFTIEMRLSFLKDQELEVPTELIDYFNKLKEASKLIKQGKVLIIRSPKNGKTKREFKSMHALITYINDFDRTNYLFTERKEKLIKEIQED